MPGNLRAGRSAPACLLLPLLFEAGCGSGGGGGALPWKPVLALGGYLTYSAALWSVLGALFGLGASLFLYRALSRLGGYRWDWAHAGWFRFANASLLLLLSPLIFLAVGFFEGLHRGAQRALTENEWITGTYPAVGAAGADAVAAACLMAARAAEAGGRPPAYPEAEVRAFREGAWELPLEDLRESVEGLSGGLVRETLPRLKEKSLERYPSLRDGLGGALFDWFLSRLGESLVVTATGKRAGRGRLDRMAREFREGLPLAAAEGGDPLALSHGELSGFLVEQTIVRGLLRGIRILVRGNQVPLLLAWVAMLVLPILFFRSAQALRPSSKKGGGAAESSSRTRHGAGSSL